MTYRGKEKSSGLLDVRFEYSLHKCNILEGRTPPEAKPLQCVEDRLGMDSRCRYATSTRWAKAKIALEVTVHATLKRNRHFSPNDLSSFIINNLHPFLVRVGFPSC